MFNLPQKTKNQTKPENTFHTKTLLKQSSLEIKAINKRATGYVSTDIFSGYPGSWTAPKAFQLTL